MNVIVFYEHLVREWKATQSILEQMRAAGMEAEAFSIIYEAAKARKYAKKHHTDIVLLPWLVEKEHEKIVYPFVKINPKVKVINLHQEEIGALRLLLPRTDYAKNGSYHFVWGEYFKEKLIECGVKPETIFVTGNSRNDAAKNAPSISKQELAEKYGLDANKKWVLFGENRGWIIQRYNNGKNQALLNRGGTVEGIKKSYEACIASLAETEKEMQALGDDFASQFEFIYRPHPGTSLQFNVPPCVHIISERSIYDWINACDLFLTQGSTSAFEAEMCGKAVARLRDEVTPTKMIGVVDYPEIAHLTEINDALIEELSKKLTEPIYTRYLGVVDGNSVARVVAATKEVYENREPEQFPLEKPTMKDKVKSFLWNSATKTTVKLNLLDKWKFPRSAYAEKRDIPYSKENAWIHEK